MDRLCEQLPVERLQQINERLSQSSSEEAQRLFEKEVSFDQLDIPVTYLVHVRR